VREQNAAKRDYLHIIVFQSMLGKEDHDDSAGRRPVERCSPLMDADLILVGGGLANSLIALSVAASDPGRRILMIDAGAPAGGHTWSFHEPDLNERQRRWIAPAVACELRELDERIAVRCAGRLPDRDPYSCEGGPDRDGARPNRRQTGISGALRH
jgi:choline dehydrogenase-like flavoprotein